MYKKILISLVLLLFTIGVGAQPLKQDASIRKGTLKNGMTYYIRHNAKEAGLADFYIAQKVGSIQEEPRQRGLAHFLEHMAFNGTKNFPGKGKKLGIVPWCETIGVKFGANLNAYTSVEQTVYNISAVPLKREGIIDSCLLILHDWSHYLLLEDKEIDKERGVIHEEWRTRRAGKAVSRLMEQAMPKVYKGTKYEDCMPIGSMDIVDNFPYDDLRDYSLEIPFYIVLAAPLFFPFIKRLGSKKLWQSQSIMVVVAALMWFCAYSRDFKDYNFHAELRMQRGVEECRWNDVLNEAARVKGPVTREMVMFRDIALINRGELCSKRYLYNNESIPPVTVSDSIHFRIADQAADLIYYNYGETIFGIRRAIERCMHYGYSYYTMRMLTQCALVNGEKENARKYLRLLGKTTFQRKWAEKMERFVEDETLLTTDEHFRMPLKLYNEGSELVGVDDKFVELTIMKKWMYNLTNDPEAQEVALGCAMIMRDKNCFWSQVQQFYNINPGKYFPIHVQEAMLFGVYELGMEGVNLSFVKFDQRVVDRYKAFTERLRQYSSQGLNEKQIGSALRPEFGDTYMWDYCVLRAVQTN